MYVSYGCQIYSEGLVDWSGASIEGLSNSFYGYKKITNITKTIYWSPWLHNNEFCCTGGFCASFSESNSATVTHTSRVFKFKKKI